MYSAEEVARRSGVARNTVYHNRKKEGYPKGIMKDGRVYFTKAEMEFFVKACSAYALTTDQEEDMKNGLLLKQSKAADFLGVSSQTLGNFQKNSENPIPSIRKGRYILYRLDDLKSFKASGIQITHRKPPTPQSKDAWKKKIKLTSDPKKDAIIQPLKYPKHECSRPGCKNITENRFLCDKCITEFSGESGSDVYAPPKRNGGLKL